MARTLDCGSLEDWTALFAWAAPCLRALAQPLSAALARLLLEAPPCGHPSEGPPRERRAAGACLLLQAGARPQTAACVDALARLAAQAPTAALLEQALLRGALAPDHRIVRGTDALWRQGGRGPLTLAQAALAARCAPDAKLTALVRAGASLVDYPSGPGARSPLRLAMKRGPAALRTFVALGYPLGGVDVHTQNNALLDAVTDDLPEVLEPLLRLHPALGGEQSLALAADCATSWRHTACLGVLEDAPRLVAYVAGLRGYTESQLDLLAWALHPLSPPWRAAAIRLAANVCAKYPSAARNEEVAFTERAFVHGQLLGTAPREGLAALEARLAELSGLEDAGWQLELFCRRISPRQWRAFAHHTPFGSKLPREQQRAVLLAMLDILDDHPRPISASHGKPGAADDTYARCWAAFDAAAGLCSVGMQQAHFVHAFAALRACDVDALWVRTWSRSVRAERLAPHERTAQLELALGRPRVALPPPRRGLAGLTGFLARLHVRDPAAAPAKAAVAAVPQALAEVLAEVPEGVSLAGRGFDALDVAWLGRLHATLVDEDVQEALLEPHVAPGLRRLVAHVLGAETFAKVTASPDALDARPLRQVLLRWHPDRAGPAHKEVADAATALIGLLRQLFEHEAAGPALARAWGTPATAEEDVAP